MEKASTLHSKQSNNGTLNQSATRQIDPNEQTIQFAPLAHEVIDMFESEYTKNLPDRKANSIINYCRQRTEGFFYGEVQSLTKIINYALKDLLEAGTTEMIPALQTLLEVNNPMTKVFLTKSKNSDEFKYMPLIPAFLNSLEPVLNYQKYQTNPNIQLQGLRLSVIAFINKFAHEQIAEILRSQQSFENKKNEGNEISPLQKLIENGTKNLEALSQSNLVDSLLILMSRYQTDPQYLVPIIEIFSYMIMYRKLALQLCAKQFLRSIINTVFMCQDYRSYIVKLCFQIIWNAIERIGNEAVQVFVNEQVIFQLKNLFKIIMSEGYKLEDKCLRNQLMILVNYLLASPQAIDHFLQQTNLYTQQKQASFFSIIVSCASIDELTFFDTRIRMGDKKAEFGTNIEDLEFKKLLWSSILAAIQSNNQEVISIIQETGFLKYLLLYIDPMSNSYAVNRWSAPQLREIQLHCLGVLANIVLYMKDDFEEKKGLSCLTKFLANTTDSERREKCLKVFNNASLFDEPYKLKITEQGLMDNLIEFLQQGDESSLEIKECCFSIIANLCRECKKNKKLFREKGGIDIVISHLKDPNVATSGRCALLALSILNCLWNAILGSRRSESMFLDSQGLYVVLEFLQHCNSIHKKMTLSCLSYLIENQKAVESFCDWNSAKTMINATQLLISIYDKEDERFGVKYENGVVKNRFRPLTPKVPPIETTNLTNSLSRTSKDKAGGLGQFSEVGTEAYLLKKIKQKVSEYDLRAIIFSILYRTGFSKNDLHASEQQKIQVIQMYPHFKVGQIWSDIKQQLQQQKLKPTSEDLHWMNTSIEQFDEEMSNCINTQLLISKEFQKYQEQDLNKFYQIIKNNKQSK